MDHDPNDDLFTLTLTRCQVTVICAALVMDKARRQHKLDDPMLGMIARTYEQEQVALDHEVIEVIAKQFEAQDAALVAEQEGGQSMKKFEVGKVYEMRSACNQDCVWRYKVTARTASTVTLENMNDLTRGKTIRCRISKAYSDEQGEAVLPLGGYSMAPVLSADHEVGG